jgi:protein phosphatase
LGNYAQEGVQETLRFDVALVGAQMNRNKTESYHISTDSDFGKAKNRFYEDRYKCQEITTAAGLSVILGVVADGIGGESAGERAAQVVVDKIFEYIQNSESSDIPEILKTAIEKANHVVYQEARSDKKKQNMGSTAAVALIWQNRLYVANVGDSRVYLIRGKQVLQLTIDHNWANDTIRAKRLPPEEALRHPRRDELVRSIGYEEKVQVDLGLYVNSPSISEEKARTAQGYELKPGDRVLICSDGLIKTRRDGKGHFVEPEEINRIVANALPDQSAPQLVKKALEREVDDNVSVIVIDVPGGHRRFRLPTLVWVPAAAFLLVAVLVFGLLIPRFRDSTAPLPSLPPIPQDQILVAKIYITQLDTHSPDGSPMTVQENDPLDFLGGLTLQTRNTGDGFVYLGFQDRAQVYLAPNTTIVLQDSNADEISIKINQGFILVRLTDEYPKGKRFLVSAPDGTRMWVMGSMMGIWHNLGDSSLYMDCLEDVCWMDGLDQPIEAGWHASVSAGLEVQTGEGTRNELWQFVQPSIVATPTASPTRTPTKRMWPTLVPTETPKRDEPPPATLTPSNTPTRTTTPTNIPTDTPIPPTDTPIPPTNTPTPLPQCGDSLDNDGDGYIDMADPGCSRPGDDEANHPQCFDGIDNDGDGLIDMADPDCTDIFDNNEKH